MPLSDSLRAYYSLDEASGNIIDAHGANDLTDFNSIGTNTGKVDSARDFNGSTQYAEIADNTDISVSDSDWTWCGWVYFDDVSVSMCMVCKYDNTAAGSEFLIANIAVTGLRLYVYDGAGNSQTVTDGSTVSTGTWYFIRAGHRSVANEIFIQVDAHTKVTAAWSNGVSNGANDLVMGRLDVANTWYLNGRMDEWAFWQRYVDDTEHSELYNSGTGRDYAYVSGGGGGGSPMPVGLIGGEIGGGGAYILGA